MTLIRASGTRYRIVIREYELFETETKDREEGKEKRLVYADHFCL